MKRCYKESKARVRVIREGDYFLVKDGPRQGGVMYPWLSNFYMDGVVTVSVCQGEGTSGKCGIW